MITQFKIFELFEYRDIVYSNVDFDIYQSKVTNFTSVEFSSSAISAMPVLIKNKSKYLSEKKLRNIRLTESDIFIERKYLDTLTPIRIKNIENYHTSFLNPFFGKSQKKFYEENEELINSMPIDVYLELTIKYYPIISKVIEKSKTLGDIIDEFTILYEKINKDLEIRLSANKYNL